MIRVGRWYIILLVTLSLAVGLFVGEFIASKQGGEASRATVVNSVVNPSHR